MRHFTLFLLLGAILLFGTPAFAADTELKTQTICPIMKGKINHDNYTDYKGQRIYFCCEGCEAAFKKNPEKYLQEMHARGEKAESVPKMNSDSTQNAPTKTHDHKKHGHH